MIVRGRQHEMQRSQLRLSSLLSRMHTLTDQNWNRNTLNNKPYYFSDNSTEMLLRCSSVTQISRVEMSSQLQGHLLTTTAMPIILSLNKLQMGEFLKKTPSAVVIKGKVSFSNQKHFCTHQRLIQVQRLLNGSVTSIRSQQTLAGLWTPTFSLTSPI